MKLRLLLAAACCSLLLGAIPVPAQAPGGSGVHGPSFGPDMQDRGCDEGRRPGPPDLTRVLSRRLHLTEAQQSKVSPMVEQYRQQVRALMQDFHEKTRGLTGDQQPPAPNGRFDNRGGPPAEPTLTTAQQSRMDQMQDTLEDSLDGERNRFQQQLDSVLTAEQRTRADRLLRLLPVMPPPGPPPDRPSRDQW